MIDIHTHILPEVDDGARSWEMAIEMCHMALQDGIEHMVATPHFNDRFFYHRGTLLDHLQDLRQRTGGHPTLSLGCDFHLSFDNLEMLHQQPHDFTIDRTHYLLVEFSDFAVPPSASDTLANLLERGLIPIITHPERNPILQRKPGRVLEWARRGCAVQVTASALTQRWGRRANDAAHWLLQREAVHILATDCHNLEGRPPVMSQGREVVAQKYGQDVAEALVSANPGAVLRDQPLPYFPAIRK